MPTHDWTAEEGKQLRSISVSPSLPFLPPQFQLPPSTPVACRSARKKTLTTQVAAEVCNHDEQLACSTGTVTFETTCLPRPVSHGPFSLSRVAVKGGFAPGQSGAHPHRTTGGRLVSLIVTSHDPAAQPGEPDRIPAPRLISSSEALDRFCHVLISHRFQWRSGLTASSGHLPRTRRKGRR